jgi:hypothetical protein
MTLDAREMVGAAGFELATLCSQSRCATRLRYAPTASILTPKSAIPGASFKKVAALLFGFNVGILEATAFEWQKL